MTKNFNEKLIELLKTDSRFVDDEGELIRAAVIDRAWKIDQDLVRLILAKPQIKDKFFDEIEGHWIFNINTFIEYISDNSFLANSYTRFRNKIGLNISDKFLPERGEVSLVWPYKDCVLEGGQTKEEEKRKEIFFNEILAQDEINRLFDPKVLTGWKRYTVDGEQKVAALKRDENGTIKENLIIKGNNLLALHTLKKQFRGKVKLIYIDPPYNNGVQTFGYNDTFNHSAWLTFMFNRLSVVKELLREDGIIWINIDDKEAHYLKVICDEVFGRKNFIGTVIWQHSIQGKGYSGKFSLHHNYIICYSKSHLFELGLIRRTEKHNINYKNPDNDSNGHWRAGDIRNALYRPNLIYDLNTPSGKIIKPPKNGWRFSKETMQEKIDREQIIFNSDESKVIYKIYLKDQKGRVPETIWFSDEVGSTRTANNEIKKLFGYNIFGTPKPERLIKRIIHISSNKGDIVLDFFAGSATTAAVAQKMKRQWITVEQMEYAETITAERLKKVIGRNGKKDGAMFEGLEYDTGGISKSVQWQGGGDFVYCELMKYNEAFMDKIQAAQSSEKLVELWQDIAADSFLNWYVNPEMPQDAVNDFIEIGKTENGLDKQKKLLAELLNKNQLYVNLSEIDDEDFKVSDADKKLNRSFYEEARNGR